MEKRTFLGIDITPRWALWQEIKYWRQEALCLKTRMTEHTLEDFRTSTMGSTNSLILLMLTSQIADLRARLARYERPKNAKGRWELPGR